MRTTECLNCLRYRGKLQCDAFPEAIPETILTGMTSHKSPYQGDRGKTFLPIPGSDTLQKSASNYGGPVGPDLGASESPAASRSPSMHATGVNMLVNSPAPDNAPNMDLRAQDIAKASVERATAVRRDPKIYSNETVAKRKLVATVHPQHAGPSTKTEDAADRKDHLVEMHARNIPPTALAKPQGEDDEGKRAEPAQPED